MEAKVAANYVFLIFVLFASFCSNATGQNATLDCAPNSDAGYDRKAVLTDLARFLNDSIPEYKESYPPFYVRSERGGGFFIQDLTDPANLDGVKEHRCVNFIQNHVYYFSPYAYDYALGFILVLTTDQRKIFRFLDCKGGDGTDVILDYLKKNLRADQLPGDIADRIRNHRSYGHFVRTDKQSTIRCPSAP